VHFTPKDWSFAYFSFLGGGKLILARLSKNLSAVSLTPVNDFSAVSLTPAINFWLLGYFWPVSTTPGKNVIAGVVDTGDKLYWWQRSALAAKLSPAAEVGHGRRYCHWNSHENAQSHLTNPDQRPRRPPKLLQTKMALFSFVGLRGLWSRCVGCFWMQLFMAVPMTPSAAVADFGGRRFGRFIPFNFLLSLAAPHLNGVLVLVTGNKFIAGVVVTGDNCSPVSLSPATKLPPVLLSPATKVIAGVVVTGDKLFTGINDTGDRLKSVTKINRRCQQHRQ
jgi:hypothetical protein